MVGVLSVLYVFTFFFCGLIFIQLESLQEILVHLVVEKFLLTFLALNFATYFTVFILVQIKEWQSKKIKTLWRIPIIGALLAHLLEANQVFLFLLLIELLAYYIAFSKKDENRHVKRLQRKQLIFYPILVVSVFRGEVQWVFLYLILTWTFKNAILNASVIKNIIYKNDQLVENV
jgi:hypothetical protein